MVDDDNKGNNAAEGSGAAKALAMPGSQCPRFDGKNFRVWPALMACALRAAEFWDVVDPGGDVFKKAGAKHRRGRQAATTLHSVMPIDVLQHLIAKETAKEV